MKSAQVTVSLLLIVPSLTSAFGACYRQNRRLYRQRAASRRIRRSVLNNDLGNGGEGPPARKIGDVLEGISKQGAVNMSKLSLAERTKRALLAEHVENQIFANFDEFVRLSDNDDYGRGKIDEENNSDKNRSIREQQEGEAKAIISQTRILRRQYDELVSGRGSSILNAMEAAMMEEDANDDSSSLLGGDHINGRYE